MDSNLQRVFAIIISVIIFFLFPIYVAYEKRDDISYALALKVTYNFVENVKSKGYLNKTMYDEYTKELAASDNTYDIYIEHTKKTYIPVLYVYTDGNFTTVSKKFDYSIYKSNYDSASGILNINGTLYGAVGTEKVILSYDEKDIKITEKQILDVLSRVDNTNYSLACRDVSTDCTYKTITSVPAYPTMYGINMYAMNLGDEFSVTIKNTNTTVAALFFNLLTLGSQSGSSTRVFVSYSGTILNESYNEIL